MAILASDMTERTKGIVVRAVRYGDTDVIANVYTEAQGMLGFMVRMPKARRRTTRNLLLYPLAILELDFDYREGKNLQRLGEVRLCHAYGSLPYHPAKEAIALFLADFLFHALRNEQANPPLYAFVESSLLWIDDREDKFANFPLTFMLRLTRFLGIWPSREEAAGLCLNTEERRALPLLLRMNYGTMHLFRLTQTQRSRLMRVANDYYRLHVDGFPELKSAAVLREALS